MANRTASLCSYNVGCTKRMGLFPNRKTSLENIKRQRALNAALKNCTVDPKKKVSAGRGGTCGVVCFFGGFFQSQSDSAHCPLPHCRNLQPPPPPLRPRATRRFPLSRQSPASVPTCRDTRGCRRRRHRAPRVPTAWCPGTPASGTSRTSTSSSPLCQVGSQRGAEPSRFPPPFFSHHSSCSIN